MGNGTRNGLMGSEKAAMECDVGLGLKMQAGNESFPCKKMMVMPHLPNHQPRLSSISESCGGDFALGGGGGGRGGGVGGGPIFGNTSNQVAYMNDTSDVVGGGVALTRSLYHFNTDTAFKSSVAAGMAASLRVPFTAAQWQELERQTVIYKYMMDSVPVPPELLIPISKSLSDVAASQSNLVKGCLGLGYSNGSDPEPWRCRRTDGKKWRCSRDVAPDQKYCERHAHKNRPRSRKPVEVHPHAHFNNNNNNKTHSLNQLPDPVDTTKLYHQKSHFLNQATNHQISPLHTVLSASSYDQTRCSDWFLKGETTPVASSNQQWQQLMQPKVGMKRGNSNCYRNLCVFQQQHEEPMSSNLGTGLDNGQGFRNEQCNLLLGPKLGSLEGALNLEQTERPRDFIDAWSTAERDSIDGISNRCSASSNGKLPISSLTLSMSGGNGTNEENRHAQMGLGIMDSERENEGAVKSQPLLNWMSPGSWIGSPPGGPLAEALCLGIASTTNAGSNLVSPIGHSSSSSTTSSSSKSSSGDCCQGLNLI